MAEQELIDQIIESMDALPEVPLVALEVNRKLDDPNVTARDLAGVITMDPSLTTKVLKLCNSAEYGFSRKIATISEAVSILGHQELKKIIFVIISHSLLSRPIEGYALEKGALWENAITCGVYARYLADKFCPKYGEQVFTGALLRDIGKIVLQNYVAHYAYEIEEYALEHKKSYSEAEAEVVGISHTEIGKVVAEKFNFPDSLMLAIYYHHEPSKIPDDVDKQLRKVVSVIHLADTFTMLSGEGLGIDGLMYPLDECVFDNLGLKKEASFFDNLYSDLLDLQSTISTMSAMVKG